MTRDATAGDARGRTLSLTTVVVGLLLVPALAATLLAMAPRAEALLLVAVLAWFAVPGVIAARRLHAATPGGRLAALLAVN